MTIRIPRLALGIIIGVLATFAVSFGAGFMQDAMTPHGQGTVIGISREVVDGEVAGFSVMIDSPKDGAYAVSPPRSCVESLEIGGRWPGPNC